MKTADQVYEEEWRFVENLHRSLIDAAKPCIQYYTVIKHCGLYINFVVLYIKSVVIIINRNIHRKKSGHVNKSKKKKYNYIGKYIKMKF